MKILFTLLITIFYFSTYSQPSREEADHYFNQGEYDMAIKAYGKYLLSEKTDSLAWFNLGISSMQVEEYDDAVVSFQKAEEYNFPIGFTNYNIAKAYLSAGNKDAALAELSAGADKGANAYMRIHNDSTFESVRTHDKYIATMEKIKLNAYPCLSDKNRRHFDFWIGEWDVYARGQLAGRNNITLANGGCMIHESYTTPGNYTGQSVNYYDPIDRKWHQHWVGAMGDTYNYIETDKAIGMLQFQSEYLNPSGSISLSRMTFTKNDDGSVSQLMESSSDGGKTWSVAFDGLYKPRK